MIDTGNLYMSLSLQKNDVNKKHYAMFGANPVGIRNDNFTGNKDKWIFLDAWYGADEYFYGRVKERTKLINNIEDKLVKAMNKGIFEGSVIAPKWLGGDTFYFTVYAD